MIGRTRWIGIIGALLMLSMIGVAYVQARQYSLLNMTVQYQDDYLVLNLFQLETEYLRLRAQWQHATTEEPIQRDTLQLRYDIFVSRVGLLDSERATRLVRGNADYENTLRQVRSFIARADLYLGDNPPAALSHDSLLALQTELDALADPVHSLSLGASHHVARQITERYEAVRLHNRVGIAMTLLLSASTLLFAIIAMRQMRTLDVRGRGLEKLATHLREARAGAEAASQAKSVFLANMSHEIRTPFHGLLGMLSLLRDTPLDTMQADYLRTATESADHLLVILNDILDMSKLESGSLSLVAEPISIAKLVSDVELLMRPQATAKGLTLRVEHDTSLPARILADPTRLKQVLFNLLSNAIKFSDAGTVTLALRRVEAELGVPFLEVAVSDNGIGMDDATLARLFQRFTQGDESPSRRHSGTGLGLEISRNLARLMGGDIAVSSSTASGSTFVFGMPLHDAGASADPVSSLLPPVAHSAPRRLSVLVAEDHPVNRKYIAALLDKLGHSAVYADDGAQALEAARHAAFDLVLMDLHMPVLDGLFATRALRTAPGPSSRARVVALTADAFPDTRERCIAAGMDDFLAKPVHPQALEDLLARHFGIVSSPASTRAKSGAPDDPWLDAEVVDGVLAVMPAARYAALLDTLLDDAPKLIDDMRAAVASGQYRRLRDDAHRLKGAALSLGLKAVADSAHRLQLRSADAMPGDGEAPPPPSGTATTSGELTAELSMLVDQLARMMEGSRIECGARGLRQAPAAA